MMDVHNLRRLDGLRSGKLEKRRPDFVNFVSICIKVSFTMLENHPCLLCGHDFANKRLLLWQFEVYSP